MPVYAVLYTALKVYGYILGVSQDFFDNSKFGGSWHERKQNYDWIAGTQNTNLLVINNKPKKMIMWLL